MSTSSSEFEPLPVFRLDGCPSLCAVILGPTGFAGVLLLWSPTLSMAWKGVGLAACGVIGVAAWHRHWPRRPRAIQALGPRQDGSWWFQTGRGERFEGTVVDGIAMPGLVLISLAVGWRRWAVIIPAGALSGEAHRQLRRRLVVR